MKTSESPATKPAPASRTGCGWGASTATPSAAAATGRPARAPRYARYAGTSGSTQGETNDTNPASAANAGLIDCSEPAIAGTRSARHGAGAAGRFGDRVRDARPVLRRDVVAGAVQLEQLRARHRGGDESAVLDRDERVVDPVHHEGRNLQLAQRGDARFRFEDGDELAPEAVGVVRAVEGALDLAPLDLLVEGVVDATEHAARLEAGRDDLLARRAGDSHQDDCGLRSRRDLVLAARARHDRREREGPIRVVDRDQLRDEAAHRRADDVRGRDVQRVEHAHRVVGEVVKRVGGGAL